MSGFNQIGGISVVNSTEAEFSDLYQDSFAGALALLDDVSFCDGDGACCCCCCCCC